MKKALILLFFTSVISSCVSDEAESLQITPQPTANLQLAVTIDNVPADDYSYAVLTATTGIQANHNVVFTTDRGHFSNGLTSYTAVATVAQPAKAYLKHNTAESALVSASVSNQNTSEAWVNFLPAYPAFITVNPAVSTLPAALTSTTIVNSQLIRLNGNVSEGMTVTYRDSIAIPGGGSIGTFLNNAPANATGNATVQYWLQNNTYHGFVYIIAEVVTNTGIVSGRNKIFID